MTAPQPYANELYESAMNAPIGTVYRSPVPDCESVQGLLISGWFYAAGLLCIAGASGLLWLAYLLWWAR